MKIILLVYFGFCLFFALRENYIMKRYFENAMDVCYKNKTYYLYPPTPYCNKFIFIVFFPGLLMADGMKYISWKIRKKK